MVKNLKVFIQLEVKRWVDHTFYALRLKSASETAKISMNGIPFHAHRYNSIVLKRKTQQFGMQKGITPQRCKSHLRQNSCLR
ncbi:MAG: hypothetical protein NPIRA05_11520 [Nitrospirales bacterium]|nr:MAG: hypothetical protein NPIRA05_11520 [Nitrospirales bacterium]